MRQVGKGEFEKDVQFSQGDRDSNNSDGSNADDTLQRPRP